MTPFFRCALLCAIAGAATGLPGSAFAQEAEFFECPAVPEPVISLAYGSRYTDDSKTRSDIDEASNAEVDRALRPLEQMISGLARTANEAVASEDGRAERVACVTRTLATWARAGELSDLGSLNANLSIGSRYAGLALAYLQVADLGEIESADRDAIIGWFRIGAQNMRNFFEEIGEMNASRNNLRAWSGLAVGAIGLATEDPALVDWGRETFRLVACSADDAGALPLEMERADKSLHYQIHAVAPLVLMATVLGGREFDGFSECGNALKRIVGFTLAAAQDPSIVVAMTGETQSFRPGDQVEDPFVMAWAEPYLEHVDNPELEAYVAPLRPLSNSKLGGNLTLLYGHGDG